MADRDRTARFASRIGSRASRRIRARSEDEGGRLWRALGSLGIVGWSVAVPTLLGIAAGVWLDRTLDDRISWTLTGLLLGVAVGCIAAWLWVSRASSGEDG